MLFTWTNVGYLSSDHAALLFNIPMVSLFSNIDVTDLPLLWLEVKFINPADSVMINSFKQALANAVPGANL